jgi:hypothetical protein
VVLTPLPGDVVKVSFPAGTLKYSAGQYMFLCLPDLSLWQWHPFSLSSSPGQSEAHMHIRALGDWTKQVVKLAEVLVSSCDTTGSAATGGTQCHASNAEHPGTSGFVQQPAAELSVAVCPRTRGGLRPPLIRR